MTNATMDPLAAIIAALVPRQLANDKIDRSFWIRTRLTGCTATEAKVLHTGSTRDKSDVVKKKIEGDDFTGNQYTDWGNTREPFLLERVGATEYGWLVHAEGKPRHMATPDGLLKTWDGFAVVECKTSKYEIALESAKFTDYGYMWQILWQMYCAGTDEAVYVWEQHDDDWSRWASRPMDQPERWSEFGPTPINGGIQRILMTPELRSELEKMIGAADRMLKRLDAKVAELGAVAPVVSDEDAAVDLLAVAAMETQAKLYRQGLDAEKAGADAKVAALGELLGCAERRWGAEVGEHEFPADGDAGLLRIGYSPAGSKATSGFDAEAAKADNAKLWAQREAALTAYTALDDQWNAHLNSYKTTGSAPVKASVRVTEKKGKASK